MIKYKILLKMKKIHHQIKQNANAKMNNVKYFVS